MEIDWNKVRRVIVDNRWRQCHKPTAAEIRAISNILPNVRIFGFAYIKDINYWGLLVESPSFPDNPYGIIRDVSITQLHRFKSHLELVSNM